MKFSKKTELTLEFDKVKGKLAAIASTHGELCLIIGSSHGLDDTVKSACDLRLSVSKMTFPHQLMRVLLLEGVYRCMNIIKGTKYHK